LNLASQSATTSATLSFLTGAAGTGKTTELRQRAEHGSVLLAATTGVAAVNLNTRTINSTLGGYFDTADLQRKCERGLIARKLHELSNHIREIAIDEISMMEADALDLLVGALNAHNEKHFAQPISLTVSGDFAQLPPVNANGQPKWAFTAKAWSQFTIERLTKIHRQTDAQFLAGLNHARVGDGRAAVQALVAAGVSFAPKIDYDFAGATIVPKNSQVGHINGQCYQKLDGPEFTMGVVSGGILPREWKELVPPRLSLKVGARVMILANARDGSYANGDLATVLDYSGGGKVWVHLQRNDAEVPVTPVTRRHESAEDDDYAPRCSHDPDLDYASFPYWHRERERLVKGAIRYVPLRLAYATTVHKSQGLTLDAVQIDPSDSFFGAGNMAYVALSRARTPQGLRIAGSPDLLAKRINICPEVKPWI